MSILLGLGVGTDRKIPGPPPGEYKVYDTFTDADDTSVVDHTPDIDVSGNGWFEIINYGTPAVILDNKANVLAGSDNTLFIDSQSSGTAQLTVELTTSSDVSTFNAYVYMRALYEHPSMIWSAGYLLTINYSDPDAVGCYLYAHGELKDSNNELAWHADTTRTIKITIDSSIPAATVVKVFIDDIEILSYTDDDPHLDTWCGLRAESYYCPTATLWDNFSVIV